MEDRQNTLAQNEAYSQAKSEIQRYDSNVGVNDHSLSVRNANSSASKGYNEKASVRRVENSRELADESVLFNRLTEKITKQIRRDVREEISNNMNSQDMRDAMVDKMDRYLEAELHTHTCKICFGE
jgi:hypothetical protein